jgi:hypothetical protein
VGAALRPVAVAVAGPVAAQDADALILDARCQMAMAAVTSPLDVRLAYEYSRKAHRCARLAGACAPRGAQVPVMFADSPVLTRAWLRGLHERGRRPMRLRLVCQMPAR